VKLQYSDDGGESLSDVWTFALGIDIESNGNLYLCFSTYYASAGAFQDIEINGSFE
jgi:hypothetical protein